jgi:hypothetical protein
MPTAYLQGTDKPPIAIFENAEFSTTALDPAKIKRTTGPEFASSDEARISG